MPRGYHCSQSDLYPSWTLLHPHYTHQPGAHDLQTKDPGRLISLPDCERRHSQNHLRVIINVIASSTISLVILYWCTVFLLVFRLHVSQHWVSYSWPWALHLLGLTGWAEKSEISAAIKEQPPEPYNNSSPLLHSSSSPLKGKQDSTTVEKLVALVGLFY